MRRILFIALSVASVHAAADSDQDARLGVAPRLDASVQMPHSVVDAPASVSIDPHNRAQVANAYLSIYLPQSTVPTGWNGNVSACVPGTTSVAYRQATIDRVNFYRALAGLPGDISLIGGSHAPNTQAAALMFSANNALSHAPPNTWLCWTQGGASGASGSNIALGSGSNASAGIGAVDLYMNDFGNSNSAVGHRRWLLYPPQKTMDSGTIPWNPQKAANALFVFAGWGARPPTPNGISWPAPGFLPWQLLPSGSNRWSFSWPNANFSGASVSMTRNGVALGAPTYEPITSGYGDNTLVWKPQGVTYAQPQSDVTYHVSISGMSGGGAPASISYDVIVIDPNTAGDLLYASGFD